MKYDQYRFTASRLKVFNTEKFIRADTDRTVLHREIINIMWNGLVEKTERTNTTWVNLCKTKYEI